MEDVYKMGELNLKHLIGFLILYGLFVGTIMILAYNDEKPVDPNLKYKLDFKKELGRDIMKEVFPSSKDHTFEKATWANSGGDL